MNKFLLFCTAIVFISISSCDSSNQEADNKHMIFHYNESAGINHLDPAHASHFEDAWASGHVFNGLVQLNGALEVSACIAKNWNVSEDKLEYTFVLRNDVFFHDNSLFPEGKGRKVVASDFVNSFFRIMDPDEASPGSYIFKNLNRDIKGMGVEAVNDSTLKIYLNEPQSSFLYQLTLPYCAVVPIEIVEHFGSEFTRHPVGTGPFMFKKWNEGERIVLVKNPNYFETDEKGNRLPYLDAVSITFIRDKATELHQFLKGRLDMLSGLQPASMHKLLDNEGELKDEFKEDIFLQRMPWLKTDYIGILVDPDKKIVKNSLLQNRLVRQAINFAINRKEIIRYLRNGIGIPATRGFAPVGFPVSASDIAQGFDYDLKKAKNLMEEARLSGDDLSTDVILVTAPEYRELCEYLQRALVEIGLNPKINVVTASVQKQMIAVYETNFFRKSWTADYPDAINFYQLFYSKNKSPNGPNYTHFQNQFYDENFIQALHESDPQKLKELYRNMEEIIYDEAPVIPLFYDEVIRYVKKHVSGLEANSMNQLSLKRVKIDVQKQMEKAK
jgi:peptide/nickel transport system substrate-binding protein